MQVYKTPFYPDPNIQPPDNVTGVDTYPHSTGRPRQWSIEQEYEDACTGGFALDIFQHVPTLRRFATGCKSIAEFGVSIGCSTRGLLAGRPKKLHCVDVNHGQEIENLKGVAKEAGIEFLFTLGDSLKATIGMVDLLHLDSNHSLNHVSKELGIHSPSVSKYILIHDYRVDSVNRATENFLKGNNKWEIIEVHDYNHGMVILQRIKEEQQ